MSWWYWTIGVAAVVIAILLALPFLIGPFLPERYECRTVVELDCDIRTAWDAILDPKKCPSGGTMVRSVKILSPLKEGTVQTNDMKKKGGSSMRMKWREDIGNGEIVEVETTVLTEPTSLVRRMKSLSVNMTARWMYILSSVDGGSGAGSKCRVVVDGVTEIRGGTWHTPVFRFIMFLTGAGRKGVEDHLSLVGRASGAKKTTFRK